MTRRLNWERANESARLREATRKPLAISKELFTQVWASSETVEEAAEILGIEPKDVFALRKSYGLPFKRGEQSRGGK